MPTLQVIIQDYDLDLLKIIATRWDIDLNTHERREAVAQLAEAMLDPTRAAHEWSRLDDRERGALQMLLASKDHKMPLAQYSRLFGEIRVMGEDKRQREKPYLKPSGIAEVLYYRGLLGMIFDKGKAGPQQFVIVPGDLAAVLPHHQTGYDLSKEEDAPEEMAESEEILPEEEPLEIELLHRADTALVDDITTLLAYLQVENVQLEGSTLSAYDRQALEDYLIKSPEPARAALMVALVAGLGLAAEDPDGNFKPVPVKARKWMDEPRTRQVRALAETWHTSTLFNELHYIPGLILESTSWQNDPSLIRQTIQTALKNMLLEDWFSAERFIFGIKESDPDFQRPAADYTSWYIRDAETNEYLRGFESWDRVDGMALYVALTQPLHWLGLADLGESEEGIMLKLTAYGRGYAGIAPYPDRPNPDAALSLEADGTLYAPRHLSTYDRFQVARFADWGAPGDSYTYHLSAESLQRAQEQGIKAEHILTFLKRATKENIPQAVVQLLGQWKDTGGAAVVLSRYVVLETENAETLDVIQNTPELRRFLGIQLGPRAVIVREGQWDGLVAELQKRGMLVEKNV